MAYNTDRELFDEIIKAKDAVRAGQYSDGIVSTTSRSQYIAINGCVVVNSKFHDHTYTPEKIRLMELENSLIPEQKILFDEYVNDAPISMSDFFIFFIFGLFMTPLTCNVVSHLFMSEPLNSTVFITGFAIFIILTILGILLMVKSHNMFNQKWGNNKENEVKPVVEIEDINLTNQIEAQIAELKQYSLEASEARKELETLEARKHLEFKIPLNDNVYYFLKNKNIIN